MPNPTLTLSVPELKAEITNLRKQLASIVKANTLLAKEKAQLRKQVVELRDLVDDMKTHLHDEVVKNVLGGSQTLEKAALAQIKKWVGKAIKVLDRIF